MINATGQELAIGQSVNVDAHGRHEEDFDGVIVGIDGINSIAHIKAPDDEIYDCDLRFVFAKTEGRCSACGTEVNTLGRAIDGGIHPGKACQPQHTPGPWRPFFRYVLAGGRYLATAHAIGDVDHGGKFKQGKEPTQTAIEAEANARLFAAALDLKSGAEKAVEWLDLIKQNYPEMVSLIEGLTELRNAIAKSDRRAN